MRSNIGQLVEDGLWRAGGRAKLFERAAPRGSDTVVSPTFGQTLGSLLVTVSRVSDR
jgi:hypothetical protein